MSDFCQLLIWINQKKWSRCKIVFMLLIVFDVFHSDVRQMNLKIFLFTQVFSLLCDDETAIVESN